jgi:hypothetical protein
LCDTACCKILNDDVQIVYEIKKMKTILNNKENYLSEPYLPVQVENDHMSATKLEREICSLKVVSF